ncbi:unnamed protein product [Colias eurytheme]|nr:unnamed protein product [Colias eurytheme]
MSKHWFVLVTTLLSYTVLCDDCVKYDFEMNFEEKFPNDCDMCLNRDEWRIGNYADVDLTPPNERSTKFAYAGQNLTCMSTYIFPMAFNGIFEVTAYVKPTAVGDALSVLVNEIVPGGSNGAVGNIPFTEEGWFTKSTRLTGPAEYTGYVSRSAFRVGFSMF